MRLAITFFQFDLVDALARDDVAAIAARCAKPSLLCFENNHFQSGLRQMKRTR
jgi:hypothetical protein